jgi:Flp pilus assembly protein TadG
MRRCGQPREQRGAALVEAAIILPLVMILTFGCIEMGIGFSQKGAIESAARAGARKAATVTDEAEPGFATDVVGAVNAALDSSAVPTLDKLEVFKDDTGTGSCSASDCLTFLPDSSSPGHFLTGYSGSFPDTDRSGCGSTPDKVTVKITGEFAFLSGLIGTGTITLTATTTLQFEPTNCP